jgi:hypothetical protein
MMTGFKPIHSTVFGLFLRIILSIAGVLTFLVAVYAQGMFSLHCNDVQCNDLIPFCTTLVVSMFCLIPSVMFVPWVSKQAVIHHQDIRKGIYILSIVMILITWFILKVNLSAVIASYH